MESVSSSTSPPLQKSRVRVSSRIYPTNPTQTHKFPFTPFVVLLIFTLNISNATSIPSLLPQIPYSQHCDDVIPESTPTSARLGDYTSLELFSAYFTGGDRILGQQNPQSAGNSLRNVLFRTRNVYRTEADGVLKLEALMTFQGLGNVGSAENSTHRRLRLVHYRPPRFPAWTRDSRFLLYGFWSSASGKLCMVGSGLRFLRSVSVVLKLNYPNSSTIATSLVNGTLQSLDTVGSFTYFQPISILGVSTMRYEYTLFDSENENGGFSLYDNMENVSKGLDSARLVCPVIRRAGRFILEYMNDCESANCNPLGGGARILPGFMSFNEIDCSDNGKVRYLLKFSNTSFNGYRLPFDPNTTLVAEGKWDGKRKHLGLVACKILNITDSLAKGSVGDCSIRLSLRFPASLSLRGRSTIVGQMWSNRSNNDLSYFRKIAFRSSGNGNTRLEGLKYEYTETDNVRKSCMKNMAVKVERGTYPNGYSSDMRFDMIVRNKQGQIASGYSSPLSVDDKFYESVTMLTRIGDSVVQVNNSLSRMLNISYEMSFTLPPDFKLSGFSSTHSVEISAEGIYYAETGYLCMIGCRHLGSVKEKLTKDNSLDCEILVKVQFSQLNAKDGGRVKGTIESTRRKSDPLYFESLDLSSSSIYTKQAEETIWRMDLEITMVLISNILSCIFVGLQLFYVNKHPDVLPFISVVMLIVLTLAHMIPLLLNFEALFIANRNRQNLFLGSGGWLEVNEVLVRVITMIAFLLQFRLLQLAWSARVDDGSHKSLWVSDKKVLYLSLPLYISGGLIAWFVHLWRKSYQSPILRLRHSAYQQPYFWGPLKSFVGLVLDGFLLPQIVFNIVCDSKERALAPTFYGGTTVVRMLPHAYDLYRAHTSTHYFKYIYANPKMDYYSTTWDVIIPCGGLLFVLLIYLQQRFGGHCFLPKRYRESSVYEKVPVVSTE